MDSHPREAYGKLRIAFLSFQVTESSFDPRHRFEREAERPWAESDPPDESLNFMHNEKS